MEIIEFNIFHLVSAIDLVKEDFWALYFWNLGSNSSTSAVNLAGYTTSGGSGLSEFNNPSAIAVDLNRTMYVLDRDNFRVVRWIPGEPIGFTVAGGRGSGSTLDKIGTSYAIALDDQSNIYISEYSNHRVSKWFRGNLTTGVRVCVIRLINFLYV